MLRTPIAGVDTVNNPRPATGGVDAERLDSARQRAALEIRSRYRAVTAEDFEFLAGEASPRVARARLLAAPDGGPIAVHIIPRVDPADRLLTYDELVPGEDLLKEVADYLDERRLIGTTVQLLPVRYRGLSVVVNLQASPMADIRRVEEDVAHALYTYLNPLVGGDVAGIGPGWSFGRSLNQGELYGIVHAVDGVEFVKILRIYETNVITGEQAAKPAGTHIVLEADELIASGQHIVKASHGGPADGAAGLGDGRQRQRQRPEDYKTFVGAGFGTLMIQFSGGKRETPEVVVRARATCARGLPSIYHEEDFGMRFVGALEEVLDPIVAVLDSLQAHFDPDLAPRDVLDLLARGSASSFDESQPLSARRESARQAAELGRRRGTVARARAGARARLPEPPAARRGPGRRRVVDDVAARAEAKPAAFIVYCDKPIRRSSRPPSRVASSRSNRYTRRTACASRRPRRSPPKDRMSCPSCGRQNPDDRDFCECGEYLRWEPTGFMPSVDARRRRRAGAAAPRAPPAPPRRRRRPAGRRRHRRLRRPRRAARRPPAAGRRPAAPATAPAGRGGRAAAARRAPPPPPRRAPPPPPPSTPSAPPPRRARAPSAAPQLASITPAPARRRAPAPRRDASPSASTPASARACSRSCATPAGSSTTTRSTSHGIPDEWYTVLPEPGLPRPLRLGRRLRAGGRDPPAPAALAGGRGEASGTSRWSRTPPRTARQAASAPLVLGIQPYEEFEPKLKPEKVSGRRRAKFDVTVRNKANAPVAVALGDHRPRAAAARPTSTSAPRRDPRRPDDDDAR